MLFFIILMKSFTNNIIFYNIKKKNFHRIKKFIKLIFDKKKFILRIHVKKKCEINTLI